MNNLPIGIFDSGLGGLCALSEIRKLLPFEDFIYFGDTGRVPYGSRSDETIIRYARQDMNFLASLGVKAVLAACGTVSTVALDKIKDDYPFPVFGIVNDSAKAAVNATKNGVVAVFGTQATVSGGAFENKIKKINPNIKVVSVAAPLLVALVENGFIGENEEITRLAVTKYVEPALCAGADTVILGCTHFPLISRFFAELMPNTSIINAGHAASLGLCSALIEKNLLSENKTRSGKVDYYVSDTPKNFISAAQMFLGTDKIIDAKRIKIDE